MKVSVVASTRSYDLAVPIDRASFFGPSVAWMTRKHYDLRENLAAVCQLPFLTWTSSACGIYNFFIRKTIKVVF